MKECGLVIQSAGILLTLRLYEEQESRCLWLHSLGHQSNLCFRFSPDPRNSWATPKCSLPWRLQAAEVQLEVSAWAPRPAVSISGCEPAVPWTGAKAAMLSGS